MEDQLSVLIHPHTNHKIMLLKMEKQMQIQKEDREEEIG
jgi:hypothetical protein